MKYTCSVQIDKPIGQVVELWEDESNFSEWQDGFVSIELLEGEKGKTDSKSKILLQQGKREMELIETIISNSLPNEKRALYEHKHMVNTQASRFEKISEDSTLYISEVEYTTFNGILPTMLSVLFPGMFRKQSQRWMNQFKVFVEGVN